MMSNDPTHLFDVQTALDNAVRAFPKRRFDVSTSTGWQGQRTFFKQLLRSFGVYYKTTHRSGRRVHGVGMRKCYVWALDEERSARLPNAPKEVALGFRKAVC